MQPTREPAVLSLAIARGSSLTGAHSGWRMVQDSSFSPVASAQGPVPPACAGQGSVPAFTQTHSLIPPSSSCSLWVSGPQ